MRHLGNIEEKRNSSHRKKGHGQDCLQKTTVGATQSLLLGLNYILWTRELESNVCWISLPDHGDPHGLPPGPFSCECPSTYSPELQAKYNSTCWVAEDTCLKYRDAENQGKTSGGKNVPAVVWLCMHEHAHENDTMQCTVTESPRLSVVPTGRKWVISNFIYKKFIVQL